MCGQGKVKKVLYLRELYHDLDSYLPSVVSSLKCQTRDFESPVCGNLFQFISMAVKCEQETLVLKFSELLIFSKFMYSMGCQVYKAIFLDYWSKVEADLLLISLCFKYQLSEQEAKVTCCDCWRGVL